MIPIRKPTNVCAPRTKPRAARHKEVANKAFASQARQVHPQTNLRTMQYCPQEHAVAAQPNKLARKSLCAMGVDLASCISNEATELIR